MHEKIQDRVSRVGNMAASMPRTVAEELHRDVGGVMHAIGEIVTDANRHIPQPVKAVETFTEAKNHQLHNLTSLVMKHSKNSRN